MPTHLALSRSTSSAGRRNRRPAGAAALAAGALCALLLAGCPAIGPETAANGDLPDFGSRSSVSERDCFRPEDGRFDTSCLSDAELAALLSDMDNDGASNLEELKAGKDPDNPLDGPDIDGDGIDNGDDDDVDGDGVPNKHDFDVDGDSLFNGVDNDIDADGLLNKDDADADGDGLSDRWDLNDDGDDDPDDEEDEDAKPKDKLQDLIEKQGEGKLKESDKNDIASEIANRCQAIGETTRVQALLLDVTSLATDPNRDQPPTTVGPVTSAVDSVFRQLNGSLAYAKSLKKDKDEPLNKKELQGVLRDFLDRAEAVNGLARAYSGASVDQASSSVAALRDALGAGSRFTDAMTAIRGLAPPANAAPDRNELQNITDSVSRVAKAYKEADGRDVVDAYERLRMMVDDGSPGDQSEQLNRFVSRLEELARDLPITLREAVDQVVQEENDRRNMDEGESAEEDNDNGDNGNANGNDNEADNSNENGDESEEDNSNSNDE